LLKEFRPIGGGGNNLQHPDFDPVPGSPEIALTPLNLGPSNSPIKGPNARTISNVIAGGTGANGQNAETDDSRASAWLYVFGQFVDHDIDLESNSPNGTPINIIVPAGDPVFPNGSVIDMTRDVRSPSTNTIINTTAGYLDLSQLYGSDAATAASLRNFDGTLKSSNNGLALPIVGTPPNDEFVTGDPRVMENPELTALLFMREHNYLVGRLRLSARRSLPTIRTAGADAGPHQAEEPCRRRPAVRQGPGRGARSRAGGG
jgi:peroxidase